MTETNGVDNHFCNQKKGINDLELNDKPRFTRITNYECFLNARSRKRRPTALREIVRQISSMPPHAITFGVGVPNVETFPFQEISISLKDGSNFKIEGKDLGVALQYMPTTGYPRLVKQLQELQDKTHGPQDWAERQSVIITVGSSEPTAAVFDMVLEEGDPVIIPVPLYTATADVLRIYKPQFIALEQDKDGIQPQELREKLEEIVKQKRPLPKLMYINPTACNPTGRNISIDRRHELYKIACEYDFLILEDDPYYLMHFMEENIPSLLSMDVEGRVIRLDSFSKILSSGLRVGYVTGPTRLIRQIELYTQVSTIHTSALSQMIVSKLLDYWGYEQYLAHIKQIKNFYRERRDLMLTACNRYLKGLAEWDVPSGGMFLWMKIPAIEDSWNLAVKDCLERYLVVVPGHPFTGDLTPLNYNYIRLSFSLATPSQIDQGIKLLSEIIQDVQTKKSSS